METREGEIIAQEIDLSVEDIVNIHLNDLIVVQDNLKDLHEKEFQKLKRSILEDGIEPLTIWQRPDGKNAILNGTQRYRVLCELVKSGQYKIDFVPCRPKQIRDEQHMVKVIADLAGQYGKLNEQGFYELTEKYNVDAKVLLETAALFDDSKFIENFLEEQDPEKQKSDTPWVVECPHCKNAFDAKSHKL